MYLEGNHEWNKKIVSIIPILDIIFRQITTFIKVLVAFFLAADPLIDRSYKNISIKGSEAQNKRQHKLLWTLWFDEKVRLIEYTYLL